MDISITEKDATICLNMIVKDESHIIKETLQKLCNKINFSYWVICDTGSSDNTPEIIQEFFKEKYNVDLVGGDTSTSQKGFIISVTAIGEVTPDMYVKRSTANNGDLICVSGFLGGAFLGLTLMEREKRIYLENPQIQPDLEGEDYIVGRLLKPEARKDIIEFFAANDIMPTSMMDLSDGLSSEVLHISKKSNLGCRLYEEKFPIHDAARMAAFKFGLDPTVCALSGGEDYELIFTIKQADYDKVVANTDITVVGYMTELDEGCKLLTKGGGTHNIEAQGWKAF